MGKMWDFQFPLCITDVSVCHSCFLFLSTHDEDGG